MLPADGAAAWAQRRQALGGGVHVRSRAAATSGEGGALKSGRMPVRSMSAPPGVLYRPTCTPQVQILDSGVWFVEE